MALAKYMKHVNGIWREAAATDDIHIGSLQLGNATNDLGQATLQVAGATQLGTTLGVTGATTLSSTLAVTGQATMTGAVIMNGGGALATGQTFDFEGATLDAASGATIGGVVAATGAWTLSAAGTALAVTNNATVGGTLGVTGAATVGSLNAGSGTIQTTGSGSFGATTVTSLNAGAGTIQTTGSMQANNLVTNRVDTVGATTLLIGDTNASAVTIGHAGRTVTVAGSVNILENLTVQGTETIVGGTTFGNQVNFGPIAAATAGVPTQNSILAQFQYSWYDSSAHTAAGFALRTTPQSAAAGVGDLSFLDAGATERVRFISGTSKMLVSAIDAISMGPLQIGGGGNATAVELGADTTIAGELNVQDAATFDLTAVFGGQATFDGPILANSGATFASSKTVHVDSAIFDAQVSPVEFRGTMNIQGATLAGGTGATISGAMTTSGAWTMNGAVSMTAAGTALAVTNNVTIGGTLSVTNGATLSSTLSVAGLASLDGGATIANGQNLTVQGANIVAGTGATISGTVTASGAWTFSAAGTALSVTNNASIGGTLSVTSSATVGSLNANSGLIQTTGNIQGAQISASTGAATPNIQASGWAGIASSATADLSIGTDAAKTRNIIMSGTGRTTTIQGDLIVNGTITGSLSGSTSAATAVKLTGGASAFQSAAAFSAGAALYVNSSGKLAVALGTEAGGSLACFGFADTEATAADQTIKYVVAGVVTPVKQTAEPAWTPGQRIYLSTSEAGKVTATAPTANVSLRVGFAISATEMAVAVGEPYVMG